MAVPSVVDIGATVFHAIGELAGAHELQSLDNGIVV